MPREAWNPDRRWADPFIATLILVILLLVGGQAQLRKARPASPEAKVSLQGRLQDIALAAPKLLSPLGAKALAPKSLAATATETPAGWDQALLAVHAGENGEGELGLRLAQSAPGEVGKQFLQIWRRCYLAEGEAPAAASVQNVRRALGDGYAARILEARLQARAGGSAQPMEAAAQNWLKPRLMALGFASLGGFLLALAGLGFGIYLGVNKARPHPLPRYGLSGRAVLIVLLGWFLTLLAAGPAVGLLLAFLPGLRPIALPLVYILHAALGTFYLCTAEGVTLRDLGRRLTPGHPGRAAWGFGFFALAFAAVMAVSLLLSPLLRGESPQKDLLELLGHLQGPVTLTLVFLTVAVLAPAFEELLFRGFLLPWLGERLERKLGPRLGGFLALAVTAITFGAMHMQPKGLPTLSTLGFVLGLAYVRTGNLATAILVHGLWNGGVFIAMRLLAS